MKKFEPTTFDALNPKDRFYFSDDAKHLVWEKQSDHSAHLVNGGRNKHRIDFKDVVFLSSEEDREK